MSFASRSFMNKEQFILKLNLVLTSILLFSGCSFTKEQPTNQQYLFKDGKNNRALNEILRLTNVEHDGTLPSIVAATQKSWLRRSGTERWEMDNRYEQISDKITPLFNKLGILEEVKPSKNKYTYAIVHGATVYPVRHRLAYALKLWEEGVKFDTLVFFVGARPLDKNREPESALFRKDDKFLSIKKDWIKPSIHPKTEAEMAHMVFNQAQLPDGFKEVVKVVFVDTPMQKRSDGSLRNPNTGDNVNYWIKMNNPERGSILAISNQPYVYYQDVVLNTLLSQPFTVETVGPKVTSKLHVGVVLDNLARWLYQENKYQEKQKALQQESA